MMITDMARDAFRDLFDLHNATNVRVFLAGQEDGAPQLGISLHSPEENDVIQAVNTISVAIDPHVLILAEDITLDVQDTPQGRGIVMMGPGEKN